MNVAKQGTPEHALDAIQRDGSQLRSLRGQVSKDGKAVILRLSPDDVLRLVDLLMDDRDRGEYCSENDDREHDYDGEGVCRLCGAG